MALRLETITNRNPKPPTDYRSWLAKMRDVPYLDILLDITGRAERGFEFLLAMSGPESKLEGIVIPPIEAERKFLRAFRAELQKLKE